MYLVVFSRKHSPARGFTLVEVLIAMLLSVFLLGALLLLFSSAQNSSRQTEELGRLQENIRFATDLLVRDLRNAGFRDDPDASFAFGSEIGQEYVVVSNDGNELTIRYAGLGSCSETFDAVRLVTNRYFVDNERRLSCRGNPAGGFEPDGDVVTLVGGVSSVSFSTVCPPGADNCVCRYNSLNLSGVDDACIGVEITLEFDGEDAVTRSITLTAALRNVILDRMLDNL